MEILPHNEQISCILYLCKDEDLKEKIYVDANKNKKKAKKKKKDETDLRWRINQLI